MCRSRGGGTHANCIHLSCLSRGPAPSSLGKPVIRPRSMAGWASAPCGRHWVQSRTKTNTKTFLHTLTQPPTLTKYTNSSVQPPQSSPPLLSAAHSTPYLPKYVQFPPKKTPSPPPAPTLTPYTFDLIQPLGMDGMILNYPIIIIDYYQYPLLIVATQVAWNSPDSMFIAPSTLYDGFLIWLVL